MRVHYSRGITLTGCAALWSCLSAMAQVAPKQVDATFLFSADVHQTFDGTNDARGFVRMVQLSQVYSYYPLFIGNETASQPMNPLGPSHDKCTIDAEPNLEMVMNLCNGIQHVRKMRALPQNSWPQGAFTQSGHSRKLLSTGRIAQPLGLVLGGDLTDCAGGSPGAHTCVGYSDSGGADDQLKAFRSIYDNSSGRLLNFNGMPFLPGLLNPNSDTPVNIPAFPGLGNHDIDVPKTKNLMRDYINTLTVTRFVQPPAGTVMRGWNPETSSYSWDWGKLHVVNVGVFPGSNNFCTGGDNYQYTQASMDWLAADLQNFAADGRPVVIASHFGFDSYSLTNEWWGKDAGNRAQGAARLFDVIKNYNVVGYYSGHVHNQEGVLKISKAAVQARINSPVPQIGYDNIVPGAGYAQNFAVTRITDSRMDVTMTKTSSDFNNSTKVVEFNRQFTKTLMPAPVMDGTASGVLSGYTQSLGFRASGRFHLLGVNPQGQYRLVRFESPSSFTVISQGAFPGFVGGMTSYEAENGTHVLIHTNGKFEAYRFASPALAKVWEASSAAGAFFVARAAGALQLVIDNTASHGALDVYQVGPAGISNLRALAVTSPNMRGGADVQMQAFGGAPDASVTTFVYFRTGTGEATFWNLNWGPGTVTRTAAEQWTQGRMRVLDLPFGSTKILLTTPPCLPDGAVTGPFCPRNPESPVYLLSVLEDRKGTDVSWRGLPGNTWAGVGADALDSFVDVVEGNRVGVYTWFANASTARLAVSLPATVGVLVETTMPGARVRVNGTEVSLPATLALVPGQEYTLSAPVTIEPEAGVRYGNPVWTDDVPVGQNGTYTFTPGDSFKKLKLAYGQKSFLVTAASNPPAGGSMSGAGWMTEGSTVQLRALPAAGYTFGAFTGSVESGTNPSPVVVNAPHSVVANFSTGTGPSAYVTTNGARRDGAAPGLRLVPLRLLNRNGSGIGNVKIVTASSAQVPVLQVLPTSLGDLGPNAGLDFTLVVNWPASLPRASFTITFSGNAGRYTGSSTLNINR